MQNTKQTLTWDKFRVLLSEMPLDEFQRKASQAVLEDETVDEMPGDWIPEFARKPVKAFKFKQTTALTEQDLKQSASQQRKADYLRCLKESEAAGPCEEKPPGGKDVKEEKRNSGPNLLTILHASRAEAPE